ncbi:hypothetical protein HM1_1119 [Heliomicrobium modesticaldum Ice1]|uniref:SLH domain-containing protein n=1 Tax=Heliobacterium modesticaldum (strain ATCC 51547 / Ice1) TaxID=498761 RepID=B0THL7_HELMI|nr:S-layer homology domain-containing protein [Heliomicrobium modesticaldum]ABZ83455.1 hypothetical protein HM1_1119 [Heliomicrobium modesticaldum Ice1]
MTRVSHKTHALYLSAALMLTPLTLTPLSATSTAAAAQAVLPNQIAGVSYASNLIQGATFTDTAGHWAEESLFMAGVHGLIVADSQGKANPDALFSKRDALLGIARLAGWMPELQTPGKRPLTGDTWTVWGRRIIDIAQAKGLLGNPARPLTGTWDDPVTREELALWTVKGLQLPPVKEGVVNTYTYTDWNLLNADSVPYIETALREGLINGRMEKGQMVFLPKQPVTRAEGAFVLVNGLKKALPAQNRLIIPVSVNDIDDTDPAPGGVRTRRIHLVGPGGEKTALAINGSTAASPWGEGIAVWKEGAKDGYALAPGDQGELYTLPALNGQISSAYLLKVLPGSRTFEGNLMNHDPQTGQIVILDPWGRLQRGQLSPGAHIWISGEERKMADIPGGTYLHVEAAGDRITTITADLPVADPGAIPNESKIRQGRLSSVEANGVRIIDEQGRDVYYPYAPGVVVRQGQEYATLDDLTIGDPVSLRLSDYRGSAIAVIEIPVRNRKVEAVYRGTITHINPVTQWITLREVSKFVGGTWTSEAGQMQSRIGQAGAVSINGQPVAKEAFLRYGKGRKVIFSASDGFDGKTITRMALLNGTMETFNDRVSKLDVPGGSLRLDIDGNYLSIDNSTIILRNGRLVDPKQLQKGDPILAFADATRNGYRAALITVDKDHMQTTEVGDGLVQGSIRSMDKNGKIVLQLYSRYRDNSWTRFSGADGVYSIKPTYNTVVYDFRGATSSRIPISDFLSQGPSGQFDDTYLYAFVQNGSVLAIALQADGPSTEQPPQDRTTLARIKSINSTDHSVVLEQVRDWSDASRRWLPNSTTPTVSLNGAVVIDKRDLIDSSDLRVNDTCLFIRDSQSGRARFIFRQ